MKMIPKRDRLRAYKTIYKALQDGTSTLTFNYKNQEIIIHGFTDYGFCFVITKMFKLASTTDSAYEQPNKSIPEIVKKVPSSNRNAYWFNSWRERKQVLKKILIENNVKI